jgi:hypothetical protein
MPATIIGNSEWTARGLVLTAQNAQEQVNGLVNVQVTYVGPASRHDQISREFYQDAPPPIWPQVVSPSELVTNRLYMVSRSVSRANGLTTVQADYVGGLQRAGFDGYFLRTNKETGKTGRALPEQSIRFVGGQTVLFLGFIAGAVSEASFETSYAFGGVFIKHSIEFVQIGQTYSLKEPKFTFRDMFVPEFAVQTFTNNIAQDPNIIFSSPAILFEGAVAKLGDYLPPKFIDRPQYITPVVKVIEREYFF